jgi:hypothetical protein
MTFATGGFHGLRYAVETTWGVIPDTPEMVKLRHKTCSLGLSKETIQSSELRDDRQIQDFRHGPQKIDGDVEFDFSYGEYDPIFEGALLGVWTTNVLKAGTTAKSFVFERAFSDIGQYGVFTGDMVKTTKLSIKPNEIVSGAFSLIGKGGSYSSTPLDASPTASQTNLPFDSFTGELSEGGSSIAVVTGLELSLENNLDPAYAVFSNQAAGVIPGRSNLTGTLSAYFENLTLLNKFINETESSLEFTLGNGTTKSYTFLVPRLKYSGGSNPVKDEKGIILEMPFQALVDATTGTNFQITRIPGV